MIDELADNAGNIFIPLLLCQLFLPSTNRLAGMQKQKNMTRRSCQLTVGSPTRMSKLLINTYRCLINDKGRQQSWWKMPYAVE